MSYHISIDGKGSHHLISLSAAELADCPEIEFLEKGIEGVKKRSMTRPFDLNFLMKHSDHTNKTNFNITAGTLYLTAGSILIKLTAYNLKALHSVIDFQTLWEKQMEVFSLVGSSNSPEPATGEVSAHVNVDNLSLVYVDNYKQVFLPVLRLDVKIRDFTLSSQVSSELGTSLEVQANFNNSRTAKWEPVIEPVLMDLVLRVKEKVASINFSAGLEGTSEGFYLNFSEELLEVVLHCRENAKEIFATTATSNSEVLLSQEGVSPTDSLSSSPGRIRLMPAGQDGGDEVYDSQFLIRNRTGFDFFIQTVGDKKGKRMLVNNLTEKFVSFLLNDEFSTSESINRDVILTFGPEIPLSRLILIPRSSLDI